MILVVASSYQIWYEFHTLCTIDYLLDLSNSCVSLKKDVGLYPPLFMDALSIMEVLKILWIHFTWNYMIDQLATSSHQRLHGCCLSCQGISWPECMVHGAFKSFVRSICVYVNIILWELLPLIYIS